MATPPRRPAASAAAPEFTSKASQRWWNRLMRKYPRGTKLVGVLALAGAIATCVNVGSFGGEEDDNRGRSENGPVFVAPPAPDIPLSGETDPERANNAACDILPAKSVADLFHGVIAKAVGGIVPLGAENNCTYTLTGTQGNGASNGNVVVTYSCDQKKVAELDATYNAGGALPVGGSGALWRPVEPNAPDIYAGYKDQWGCFLEVKAPRAQQPNMIGAMSVAVYNVQQEQRIPI